jgi:hypothetical protein
MLAVPPVSAVRIWSIALAALVLSGAADAAPQPVVTLLAPANGTLVQGQPSFTWRLDSAQQGPLVVTHQVASDVAFTQDVTTTTRQCGATNCWTAFRPARAYPGRHYWRVTVAGAVNATSPTWMFQGVAGRLGPDRGRPRVQAYAGSGRRGRKAVFVARVADDRGEARIQVDLAYRNQLVFRTMTLLKPVRWSVKQRFDSRIPLPRSLAPAAYRVCVTAWDRTGNRARSCARFLIR